MSSAAAPTSFRGLGRHRLSPQFPRPLRCDDPNDPDSCDELVVGGRSVVEGSAEFRWLPPLKPFGAVFFSDIGAANEKLNPFDDGISLAVGMDCGYGSGTCRSRSTSRTACYATTTFRRLQTIHSWYSSGLGRPSDE